MELIEHRCKRCGGELKNVSEGRWSCPYCACVYDEAVVQKNTRALHEEFDEIKREIVCNLRRNLYDAVNEEYISSEKVRECAIELKKYIPDDFAACFYEVAVGNNVKQLTRYIRKINIEENYSEIECVVRFLIKSLQTEYLLELNNLVERTYKMRDLSLFEKYSTEISCEAEKVENGVYETKMPREVFIAYSSKDMEMVSELCEVLEAQGLKCFVAARNLRHGKGSVENYDRLLCEAMDHCKSFVFVSSTNSRQFSCDALTKELPYIQERDIKNAPAEHKNNYANMPHSYKKPRVEYRIEESRGFNAADAISNEFFDGYERVYSPEAVAERVAKQLVATHIKKTQEKKATPSVAPIVVQSAPADSGISRVEPLLKRARIYLEDGEWQNAEKYCEKVLDIDPENAQTYIIKLLIDLDLRSVDELVNCEKSFEDNGNFKKAIRFGDAETVEFLNSCIVAIEERKETERKDKIYNLACSLMREGNVDACNAAISKFGEIPNWKDSKQKIEECQEAIKTIKEQMETARKNGIYGIACALMTKDDIKYVKDAIGKFKSIPGWKDADRNVIFCEDKLKILESQAAENAERERIVKEQEKLEAAAKAKKRNAIVLISIAAVFVLVISILLINEYVIKPDNYSNAVELYESGDFADAYELFRFNPEYKDSQEKIAYCEFALGNYEPLRDYIEENEISELIIPNGVTSIGDSAFSGCSSLTSVTIPDSVSSIGSYAFNGCSSLKRVRIPDSVTSIGNNAFNGCSSLTSVTIPDNVTSIGSLVFSSCTSLTSITIPDSVTSIGNHAFYGCIKLSTVFYKGTVAQWSKISIGPYGNSCLTSANIVYI